MVTICQAKSGILGFFAQTPEKSGKCPSVFLLIQLSGLTSRSYRPTVCATRNFI